MTEKFKEVFKTSTATTAYIVGRVRERLFYGCLAFRKGVLPADSE